MEKSVQRVITALKEQLNLLNAHQELIIQNLEPRLRKNAVSVKRTHSKIYLDKLVANHADNLPHLLKVHLFVLAKVNIDHTQLKMLPVVA